MTKTVLATYDGKDLLLEDPLDLPPNTRVTVTINGAPEEKAEGERFEWLDIAASMNLDLPPNASERIHEVLYGIKGR